MGCLVNNINNINLLNECEFVSAGISKLYITSFNENFISSLQVFGNTITSIGVPMSFNEIVFSRGFTKYSEVYNYADKKYEQTFDLEIKKYYYEKRNVIDALIKSKLIFIFKDFNGNYFLLGESSGLYSTGYSATTDVYGSGKSSYVFKFSCKSDFGLLGIPNDLIDSLLANVDCSIFFSANALTSPLYISDYNDCIITL